MTHAPEKSCNSFPLTAQRVLNDENCISIQMYTKQTCKQILNSITVNNKNIIALPVARTHTHTHTSSTNKKGQEECFFSIQFHDVFISEEKTLTSSHTYDCDASPLGMSVIEARKNASHEQL